MKAPLSTFIIAQVLVLHFCVCHLHAQSKVEYSPPKLPLLEAVKLTDRFTAKHYGKPAHHYFLSSVEFRSPGGPGGPFGSEPYWIISYSYTRPSIIGIAYWVSMKGEIQGAPQE